MGGCMQPKSPDDAFRHEIAPQQRKRMAEAKSDAFEEQEDQWAVLRHEVEVEDMKQQDERARVGRERRDTEEDAIFPQSSIHMLEEERHHADIVVVGIGGGGMNAVNRMIATRVRGVRFIAMNTDAQVLSVSEAPTRICLGQRYTKGLGAGGNASVGTRAATESENEIRDALGNPDLVFIAAGMGGGTGTGATPVVASIAKNLGALTIGIVTLPFTFEGTRRRRIAEEGIAELSAEIDALISVPNDRLLAITAHDRSLSDAFKLADDVLRQGVQGIAEVINVPGLVNVDFADVRSVLNEAGTALMSIGQGYGRNRAQRAAEEAIAGGFLNVTIRGAQRVLFNISGGDDMTLFEVNEVAECIGNAIDNIADITFGAVVDPTLNDTIRVTLIAAGMDGPRLARPTLHQASHADQLRSYPASLPQAKPPNPPLPPARLANQVESLRPGAKSALPHVEPQPRTPAPPARPQRSLDDLRGLRSLGRQGMPRTKRDDEDTSVEEVDVPPFLRKFD
jgi:cell division protein FtsZ